MKLQEQIFQVIQKNDKEGLLALIPSFHQQKISLDQRNGLGQTPLSLAISKGFFDLGELLLNEGSNPNTKDLLENTPMQYLLNYEGNKLKGFDKMFLSLLESGASLDEESLNQGPILSQLIKAGRNNMLCEVLKSDQIKPSLEEIHQGFLCICRAHILLNNENRYKDRSSWNSLNNDQVNFALTRLKSRFIAIQKEEFPEGNLTEHTKKLMNQRDAYGRTFAINSIIYGNVFALDYLIQNDADLSIQDDEKLRAIDHFCMSKAIQEEQISKSLYNSLVHWVRNDHKKNIQFRSPFKGIHEKFDDQLHGLIEKAIVGNKFEVANWLYQDGVKPTKEGKKIFSKVLAKLVIGNDEPENNKTNLNTKVASLLVFGANPNDSVQGRLPLNEAIKDQKFDLAILLLQGGARFKNVDEKGFDALMLLAKTPYNPKEGEFTLQQMNENHQSFSRVISLMEKQGLDPSSKIDKTKDGVPLSDFYMKMAMDHKNIPVICSFIEKGYSPSTTRERNRLRNFMMREEGAFVSSVYLNTIYEILDEREPFTVDERKEREKSEVLGSDLYNIAIKESKFELAERIKKNLQSKGLALNLNQPDALGRTAFLNSIVAGKADLANEAMFSYPLITVDFTKKDVFGDNCLHYLCSKSYPKHTYFVHQKKNEIHYVDPSVEEQKRSKLFHRIIDIIQNLDPNNTKAKEMLKPERLREYFQIAVDSGNLVVSKTLIQLGVLESMKEELSKVDAQGTNHLEESSVRNAQPLISLVSKLESLAAKEGDIATLKTIFDSGVSVDFKSEEYHCMDETPLFQAIKYHKFKTATWLLDHDANPNSKDALGRKALMVLCGSKDIEKVIVEDFRGKEEFYGFYQELLTKLLERTEGLQERGGFAKSYIKASLEAGNIKMARTLIGIGNAINKRDPNREDMSLPEEDLPYIYHNTPPFPKSTIRAKDILKLELQFLDAYKTTKNKEEIAIRPLLNAAAMSNVKEVSQLLMWGVDIHGKDEFGKSAIFYGAEFGNVDTLKVLLKNKAKVYQEDRKGKTPLDYAIEKGKIHNAAYLISKASSLKVEKENVHLLSQLVQSKGDHLTEREKQILNKWISNKIGRAIVLVSPKTQNAIVPYNHVSSRRSPLNLSLEPSSKKQFLENKKTIPRKFTYTRPGKRVSMNKKIISIRKGPEFNPSFTL
jgi:ankyrin repeat protein